MKNGKQDAHTTKKEMLVARGIIKADPAENIRFQEEIPRGFSLNLCSHCNYRCRYCPQGLSPQPEAYLDIALVKRVFDELQNRAVYVQISARGESLLHPNFFEIIDIIKEANPDSFVCLNTNGSLLDTDKTLRLATSGIDQIQISLQTLDAAIHRQMTGSLAHSRVISGIIALSELIRDLDRKPLLTAQFLDTEENGAHRRAFTDFCTRHGIHCHIQQMHSWGDTFEAPPVKDTTRYPCPYLFLYPTIHHDGLVSPCFVDFHAKYAYGSITQATLVDIWHSPRAREMREMHLTRQWGSIPICHDCRSYRLISSGFVYRDGRFHYKP